MSEFIEPRDPFCRDCLCPAEFLCKCNNVDTYICGEHLESHLDRDCEHPIRAINRNDTPEFEISSDIQDLEQINIQVRGHCRPITSLAVHQDDLFSGERDGVYRWDSRNKRLIQRYEMKSQVWNIAILSSKNLLAAALENKSVEVLDFNTGEIKHSHEFHSNPVTQVKFTTDGKLLISACAGGNLVVYSLDSSDCIYDENIHTAPIVAMSISFDNKYTVTSSAIASDGVIIWDIERCCKKFIYTNKEHFKEPIVSIFCTSTNTVVFGGYEGNVFILDYLTNKLLKNEPKKIEKRKIYSIIVKNDLSEIILADHHDWINRYSYPDVEDISGNFEDRNYLTGLVYDKNEERIFGISGGKSIREFINDEELTRLGTIGHDTLVCVKITRDRKYLAGFYLDGGVVFYDPGSGKVEHYFESIGEAYQMIEEYPEFEIHLDDEDIG